MRHGIAIAVVCLLAAGSLPAQERIPLPPPDPASAEPPATAQPAPYLLPPIAPAPQPGPPPPSYVPPPPYSPYPPPPGGYAAPPPYTSPPLLRDHAGDPLFCVGIEGLVWWTKNQPLSVPLATTGPASQGASAGNLGAPGTTSLNGPLDYDAVGGVRVFAGGWFNVNHTIGMDGSLFILGQQSAGFGVSDHSGNGSFVINEPIVGAPFTTQVSAPGVLTGSVFVNASSRFGGGDINVLFNLLRSNGWTINLLGGYRYLQLDESLTIEANSYLFTTATYTDNMGNVLATAPPGSSIAVIDQFHTRNQFNGGQIGTEFQYMWGRLSISGAAKLALGATHEVVTINGSNNVFPTNAAPVFFSGGNYATLQIGRYGMNRFAVAPEGLLSVGYQLTPWCRAQIGYDFLFLSSVVRPGNQIDNTYDGVAHPGVPMTTSSFWGQGLNSGLQFTF